MNQLFRDRVDAGRQLAQLLRPFQEVDEIVCLAQPEPFYAVGPWYVDFTQVDDDEVLSLLGARL